MLTMTKEVKGSIRKKCSIGMALMTKQQNVTVSFYQENKFFVNIIIKIHYKDLGHS